jgi:hypothetical protein
VRELHDAAVARQAEVEAQKYIDDTVNEESRVATTAMVAAGTTVWLLVYDDETEVEDNNNKDEKVEAVAEAERDTKLCAAVERAAHWVAEMDNRLPEGRRSEGRRSTGGRTPRQH